MARRRPTIPKQVRYQLVWVILLKGGPKVRERRAKPVINPNALRIWIKPIKPKPGYGDGP
jgi:hypothetical protein